MNYNRLRRHFQVPELMKMMTKEIVKSMMFIDHSKKVDIKEQKAKNLDETYEFDIPPERFG